MTPAEGVKRAAQALSLLWPFAVIAAVSFGRMSLLLAAGLPLFAFQAIFTLRKGIRGASLPALLISVIGTAVCGLGLLLSEASLAFWYPVFVNLALLLAFAASLFGTPVADAGIRYCRKVTVAWCIFFIANGGVAAATVLSGNRAAWLLWNGCLSYGAIGLMMGIEYLVRRRVMRHAA